MRKIKLVSFLVTLVLTGNTLFAQSVEDGKKFLYYERYNSAKNVFQNILNANPNNQDAAYWLGQTYLGEEDSVAAKDLYQKTLNVNSNSPLMLVGMGEIALMDNQKNEARNRFETAISLTKGKDYNVINAIGRANVDARNGDALYAISKLQTIPENKRTPEIWTTLGDAYRKMTDGANAQLSYQSALAVDPNYAKASFMIGRIYQTQGYTQEPFYMKYYEEAMTKDPKFAPVYNWLHVYYYNRDINKSRDYLNRYITVSDADSKNCYYQAAILYASGLFQQTINKANECIASGGANPYANLFGLKAFAYDRLGDSLNAKTYFEMYFQKQKPEKLESGDYAKYGQVLLKFPGNEAAAANYIGKAVALDTLEANKIQYITSVANNYLAAKNFNKAADWYTKIFPIKKDLTKTDIFNAGYNYYKGENYHAADSIFKIYSQKYPDDILGYYMSAISEATIDSAGKLGLAKPSYEKVIQIGEASKDSAAVKAQLIVAYNYLVAYNYNTNKDIPTAISYIDKILAIDPTNATSKANKEALQKALENSKKKVKVDEDKVKTKTETTKEKVTATKTKYKKK